MQAFALHAVTRELTAMHIYKKTQLIIGYSFEESYWCPAVQDASLLNRAHRSRGLRFTALPTDGLPTDGLPLSDALNHCSNTHAWRLRGRLHRLNDSCAPMFA